MFNDKGAKIDTIHAKPDAVVIGEQIESDRHYILIEERKSEESNPQHSTGTENKHLSAAPVPDGNRQSSSSNNGLGNRQSSLSNSGLWNRQSSLSNNGLGVPSTAPARIGLRTGIKRKKTVHKKHTNISYL